MPALDGDIAMQTRQHLRIAKPFAPIFLQFLQQNFLGVIILGESARGTGDFHVVWTLVPADQRRYSRAFRIIVRMIPFRWWLHRSGLSAKRIVPTRAHRIVTQLLKIAMELAFLKCLCCRNTAHPESGRERLTS